MFVFVFVFMCVWVCVCLCVFVRGRRCADETRKHLAELVQAYVADADPEADLNLGLLSLPLRTSLPGACLFLPGISLPTLLMEGRRGEERRGEERRGEERRGKERKGEEGGGSREECWERGGAVCGMCVCGRKGGRQGAGAAACV